MPRITRGALAVLAVTSTLLQLTAAQQQACAGEYSRCPNGVCALLLSQCSQCAPNEYACPMSTACFATPNDYSSCPGLSGTHFDATLSVEQRLDYFFAQQLSLDELISQLTDNSTGIARLAIPPYVWLNDNQHGVKQPDATAFPNGASLGATWNPELVGRVGLAIGVEARGVHNSLQDKSGSTGGTGWPGDLRNGAGLTFYAPNLNLVHDPRWGRANEVMSEDPHLMASLVASYVAGMQNNTATGPLLAAACCKHYAAYNLETNPSDRTVFDAVVTARDLWETYLPAFDACITKGRSQSVMCSYNSINGVPTCASYGLLTEVLRNTWGFDGFVVSDYDALMNVRDTHHYVKTYTEAAAVGIGAGIDQEGGGGPTYPPMQQGVPAALQDGSLTMAQVIQSVRRLMRIRVRLGMLDPPTGAYNAITHASVASPEHLALAEEAARDGMTLLRNRAPAGATAAALPLNLAARLKRLAVIGPNANESYILLGSYSDSKCCTAGIPTVLHELTARAASAGVAVSYAQGCDANCASTGGFSAAAAAAGTADAVIVVLGMGQTQFNCNGDKDRTACESEAYDRPTCAMPGQQPALVAAIRAAVKPGVPVIAVLVHGGAFCLTTAVVNATDAILDACPAGRSPVTWYASDASLPKDRGQMSPYPNTASGSPGLTYRFYDADVSGAAPVFTFGEGLSYTTFNVTGVNAPASVGPCDPIPVVIQLVNTGSMASDVVVQVFLAQQGLSVPAPRTRLVTFGRLATQPGVPVLFSLPSIDPTYRAVIHENGGNATDIFSLAGKRWNEQGTLQLRVVWGQHNGASSGGVAFQVSQTGSQDLSTC